MKWACALSSAKRIVERGVEINKALRSMRGDRTFPVNQRPLYKPVAIQASLTTELRNIEMPIFSGFGNPAAPF
jgi:hypothetical protein